MAVRMEKSHTQISCQGRQKREKLHFLGNIFQNFPRLSGNFFFWGGERQRREDDQKGLCTLVKWTSSGPWMIWRILTLFWLKVRHWRLTFFATYDFELLCMQSFLTCDVNVLLTSPLPQWLFDHWLDFVFSREWREKVQSKGKRLINSAVLKR